MVRIREAVVRIRERVAVRTRERVAICVPIATNPRAVGIQEKSS